ncbi:MAG TPA: prepilin-type N-terminal cleavage/methylation domain-containing protein [Verrucomicrobiae bacterium]|nr:prepilin-type N-terminal cleavage/methylation domain-containing protein [Verrucomicrobiae bacterium]
MRNSSPSERQAFTLVEIMIIVALIGLLAALAVPTFIKARKQSQGKRIVNDARIIDAAINAWAMETGRADGDSVDLAAAAQYTKSGVISASDVLGNSWVIGNVGTEQLQISPTTKDALSSVGIDWGPY